ncbi:MAG: ABC transporter substrate-binding protein [Azospirillum sp.]|nr:ABC transporter substrate-binding protein [Azospirillum sp.]MCA3265777.1 ABC transporter substrate-binding protein [Azospirillum sp.]
MKSILRHLAVFAAMLSFAASAPARAQGANDLALVCSFGDDWCRLMAAEFERETGIRVAMIRRSTGEVFAQLKAEAQRPRVDVWWGGTGDPHIQAAAEGLTEPYRSPRLAELRPWAVAQAEKTGHRSVGVIAGALALAYNETALANQRVEPPKCWADLVEPRYRNLVQANDPSASGTGYAFLATMVALMGEEGAFAYLRRLHPNVNAYARSGTIPARAVATGESPIGITFYDNALVQIAAGARGVRAIVPCEGTSYEVGSMSIVRGARNMAAARRFYDWALSAPAQALGVRAGLSFSVPSNKATPLPDGLPDLGTMKLVDYDFRFFGDPETRTRLLRRFDVDVRGRAQ